MNNKILVEVFVPEINEKYDIYLPINKKIGHVIRLLIKSIYELTEGSYCGTKFTFLYNKETGEKYDINQIIKDTDIRNGTELILM